MSELKCRACKCQLFLQTRPGKPAKYLCPFCGARYAEGKSPARKVPKPPTLDEALKAQKLKGREWVTWTGRPDPLTWLVSWDAKLNRSVIHAEIVVCEDNANKPCWDYWVWVRTSSNPKPMPKRGYSSKSMADAKQSCRELLQDAGDIELVELPSAR